MSTLPGTANRRRGQALLAFLLQLVMAGVLPAVHALTEKETLRHIPHLEAQNDGMPCPAAHEHVACATCRVLHHSAVLATAVRVADTAAVQHETTTVAAIVHSPPPTPSGSLGSRAPPIG